MRLSSWPTLQRRQSPDFVASAGLAFPPETDLTFGGRLDAAGMRGFVCPVSQGTGEDPVSSLGLCLSGAVPGLGTAVGAASSEGGWCRLTAVHSVLGPVRLQTLAG